VFTTGGYANPTLTIMAFAIRIADRVKQELRAGAAVAQSATMA
jgi:choline dehydrogenase-like flavoprotein